MFSEAGSSGFMRVVNPPNNSRLALFQSEILMEEVDLRSKPGPDLT